MASKSYIPRDDAGFDGWQKNFMIAVNANYASWGIPGTEINPLITKQTAWTTAYAVGGKGARTSRDPGETAAKTAARAAYEKGKNPNGIRAFVKKWITGNNLVTNAQRTTLGVTVPKGTHTRHKDPITELCYAKIQPIGGGKLKFACATAHDTKRASKAETADGVLISYSVRDMSPAARKAPDAPPLPTSPDDCDKQKVFSAATFLLATGAGNAGKSILGFVQWNDSKNPNRVGIEGEMFTAHIN